MSFHQYIQYKALGRIYGATGEAMIDQMTRDPAEAEKLKMRNVCALISNELFDSVENMCGLLEISKRKFIEEALIEALAQANKIVEDEGVFEAMWEQTHGAPYPGDEAVKAMDMEAKGIKA